VRLPRTLNVPAARKNGADSASFTNANPETRKHTG